MILIEKNHYNIGFTKNFDINKTMTENMKQLKNKLGNILVFLKWNF